MLEFAILTMKNIKEVALKCGRREEELEQLLEHYKAMGRYEIRIPIPIPKSGFNRRKRDAKPR